ncbi:unnamed protein product [Linum trigynum]|uniref:Uncharacterized protein n=1 Tax=Linum trigynum TaxID=586398 RepID=A0AAV2F6M1_9ROSI
MAPDNLMSKHIKYDLSDSMLGFSVMIPSSPSLIAPPPHHLCSPPLPMVVAVAMVAAAATATRCLTVIELGSGALICSFVYSCRAISTMNLLISTRCIYTPVDLGPLQKLKCSSVAGLYRFHGWIYFLSNVVTLASV